MHLRPTAGLKQQSLRSSEFSLQHTRTRRFLDEVNAVVPWQALVALVHSFAPKSGREDAPRLPLRLCCARALKLHAQQRE